MQHDGVGDDRTSVNRRALLTTLGVVAAGALVGCSGDELSGFELFGRATELANRMHVALNQAADASNRAVMAEFEDAAQAAAKEASAARGEVRRDGEALAGLLSGPGFSEERAQLDTFNGHFDRYEALDKDMLALAVQKSNLAARRLSHGPASEAADAVRAALDAMPAAGARAWQIEALKARVLLAVREIQVAQAPHIAEPTDAEMTRLEQRISEREAAARGALRELAGVGADVQEPTARLDAFLALNTQILALSRQNTDVRSLALSLGDERAAMVACEGALAALIDQLAARWSWPTR